MTFSKTSVKNAKHLEAIWLNVTNGIAKLRRYYPMFVPLGNFEIALMEELTKDSKVISKDFYVKNIVDINQLMENGFVEWVEPVSGSGRILADDFVENMTLQITVRGRCLNPVDFNLQMLEGEMVRLAEFIHETAPKGSLTYPKPKPEQVDIDYKAAVVKAYKRISNMTDEQLEEFINDSKEIKGDKLVQYAIIALEERK